MFMNISDRYGDYVPVTIEDYRELNPEGKFSMSLRSHDDGTLYDVIIEEIREGEFEVIAETA